MNEPINIINGKYHTNPASLKEEKCPDAPAVIKLTIAVGSLRTNDVMAALFKLIPSPIINSGM